MLFLLPYAFQYALFVMLKNKLKLQVWIAIFTGINLICVNVLRKKQDI